MNIQNIVGKIFERSSNILLRISRRMINSELQDNAGIEDIQRLRCIPWFKDNGDKTLRLNYDLSDQSIVFDLGGYEGQWASDIFSKYCCNIYLFEPYMPYAQSIRDRFARNHKIKVYDFGLSRLDETLELNVSSDRSSVYIEGGNKASINLQDAIKFFESNNITEIDLIKINIEGGEYDLLERLLQTEFTSKIKNIQVQFHDFVPNSLNRMKSIQSKLSESHYPTYQYEYVWENWKLKS